MNRLDSFAFLFEDPAESGIGLFFLCGAKKQLERFEFLKNEAKKNKERVYNPTKKIDIVDRKNQKVQESPKNPE